MTIGDNQPDRGWDAIVVNDADDVAVMLRDVAAQEDVRVRRAGTVATVRAAEAIPLGHKMALQALAAGAVVRKYGEAIGATTAPIAAGAHVHVHNLKSQRAKRAP